MATRHAGYLIVETLRELGTEVVFGLAGVHVYAIYDALEDAPGITVVNVKHENTAAVMADVYGRLTRRPGVLVTTAGPGGMNALSGIGQAFNFGSPVVHLCGTVPHGATREALHGLDDARAMERLFRPATKWSAAVDRAEDLPKVLHQAFAVAMRGKPGPVHLSLPWDMLRRKDVTPARFRKARPRPPAPPEAAVGEMAAALRRAERPVLFVGRGPLMAGAAPEVVALAEALGAAVVVPRDAIGVFPEDHPLMAGYMNHVVYDPFPVLLLEESDAVLALGVRSGGAELGFLGSRVRNGFLHVGWGDAPEVPDGARLSFTADIRLSLDALRKAVGPEVRPLPANLALRMRAHREALAGILPGIVAAHAARRPIHPGVAMAALARHVSEDAALCCDVGNCEVWMRAALPATRPERHIGPGLFQAMGFALPAAVAAKLAQPERPAIGVVGDGALLMFLGDLAVGIDAGAPIMLVVLNDGGYGMNVRFQVAEFGRPAQNLFRSPNFAAVAEAFGAVGIRVEDPGRLDEAFARAVAANRQGRTVVVEVMSGHDDPWPPVRETMERVEGRTFPPLRI
jgi:acetolactate synthase-1/2/3 large subunit